ncbi:relaxase domain-containing protein [Solirubrobacter sp. CPCC 204708]|uniref:Relaxase domain-containing protein n=1 Tax=Solirubrobacter deserti TaxID=2282478 RepID=A0ABT4RHR9_9ACTN|nr:MobF family relaxase [Solirubrobacter deserti]MBE2316565.1 relaxase domain-containing protein [Solirubrobacter deserti]MDA0138098.1 relaxase domain-containing protein [Solirubrobacter deserti]
MLSIGKLAADQAKYYLDQAEARVDVVQSVGGGIEDYYVGPSEARGRWIGVAAHELELRDDVGADALRRVLDGLDPRDGTALRTSTSRATVAGFDLTFSAPKSVSVLFGVGDEQTRARVREAHDLAVREAVGHMEKAAAAVRRGHGGVIVEEASGLVAAAFRHRTSRAGDPQLHTHVLVANLGRGVDGRWSALDGRRLYAEARTASFLYQAVLRGELTRRLGVEWTPVRRGIAEVLGVPRAVQKAFSRRRAEIEAALEERGTSGARAAEAAALATRRVKDPRVNADMLVDEWRSRAAELGFGRQEIERIVGRARERRVGEEDWARAERHLAGPNGLTRRTATFGRGDVLQQLCEALPRGSRVDAQMLERRSEQFLEMHAVPLLPDDEARTSGEGFRRRDGRLMPAGAERLRYSTPEHLALERRVVEDAVRAREMAVGVASDVTVERVLAARPTLSKEQRRVIESLCLDGHGVAVVAGRAGTGKTFTLGVAREAWHAAGHPVLGVAIARRAADELRQGAGISSTSIAALLGDLEKSDRLPERCVLVVDEAGMVPTRDLAALLEHVQRASGKLVLVGDDRQLPSIEAGGAFRGLIQRGLAVELGENVRQVNRWEREALDHLRAGRAEAALGLYGGHGALTVEPTAGDARERLVRDWMGASGDNVMIAQRRADVADLNARARVRLQEARRVGGAELDLAGGAFAVGDRVVVKRNDPRLGVTNGQRGEVVALDAASDALTVACGGRRVELDREFLTSTTRDGEPSLLHGYAMTGHVAQGATVDHCFVLASEGMSREWAYVALSRGRKSNRLYVAAQPDDARAEFAPVSPEPRDPVERLVAALSDSEAPVLAIDSRRTESSEVRVAAQREAEALARERVALQRRGRLWLPGRRRDLDDALAREAAAKERAEAARRREAEAWHGARRFVSEQDLEAQLARQLDRVAECANERVLQREQRFGREL